MSVTCKVSKILEELTNHQRYLNDEQLENLINAILQANHIFTVGMGRSGVSIRAFANRLMHLGFEVSVIGDMASPHSKLGDLVIICSGSGETDSLVALARKAKSCGVKVVLITMDAESVIAKLADIVTVLPGVSPKLKHQGIEITSVQPMGSAFEQMVFLTCDGIVLELMERTNQTSEEMFTRHADFE